MFSYWEQQSFSYYDHIIIGAGIVGLSVAIELRQRFPKERILILERGLLPTGASSRNAGFACMGSVTELLQDLETMSVPEVLSLFAARKKGLELLRARLGDQKIGYTAEGSYELIDQQNRSALATIERLNQLLYPINQQDSFSVANERIQEFGFAPEYTQAMIQNNCEGAIHTGAMLRALCDLAIEKNIEIKTNALVQNFEETANEVQVIIPDSYRKEDWRLRCRQLYICTNAFTKQLLPLENVIPGRGQIILTQPISNLKFKGTFHLDAGYYYFRTIDNRVLLGGGRNLDFETETSSEFGPNPYIQSHLVTLLKETILPNTAFEIAQNWSGIMAFGNSKSPIVKAFSARIYGAFRMGGMGVAMGSEVAERLVTQVVQ